MTYPVWPSTLANPRSPLAYKRGLPLEIGQQKSLGKVTSARKQTRDVFKASVSVPIEASLFQTFFLFWRDTLSNGTAIFTAPWIADLGHPEYVTKITTYTVGMNGIEPLVTLELELKPDVKLDPTNTFSDPWQP